MKNILNISSPLEDDQNSSHEIFNHSSQQWKMMLVLAVILLLIVLSGCQIREAAVNEVPEGTQVGELLGLKECNYQPEGSKTKYSAQCGNLIVPERWDIEDSRRIALPVVRIPATNPIADEPVFYLQGGPGQSNLSYAPPDWLFANHDVIFVGYRGIDGSEFLACPNVTRTLKKHLGKDLFSDQASSDYAAAVRKCAAGHTQAGVDLSGYTIPNVIQDLEATRNALGYLKINLLSESYGTRVAQIYAAMYPASLHRMILIGVNTPGRFVWDPAEIDDLISYISNLCGQDTACSERTEDLARTVFDVNRKMARRWLFFNIDPDTVRLGANFLFLNSQDMAMVFDSYLAADQGDMSGLAMLNLFTSLSPIDRQVLGDLIIKAGSVDLDRYRGVESVSLGGSIMGAPMAEWIWPLADEWPLDLISKDLREFQESNVEMLLINGTIDFSTPPQALDEVDPYYHRVQTVLLPEFGHINDVMTLQPRAFEKLVTSFYSTGVGDDSGFVYQPLSFEPKINLPVMAKILTAVIVLVSGFILTGISIVVRRLFKNQAMNKKIVQPQAIP